MNVFSSASFTYINSRMQAKLEVPVGYAGYRWKGLRNESFFCFSPAASVKYDITEHVSVSADVSLTDNPVDRKRLYGI